MGIKADIKIVWKVLLYAIGTSILLSILSVFIDLPIYYNLEDDNILANFDGRLLNANASFGIIGLYLLFSDDDKWYNQGKLVKYVSVLSVIALIITFNRTYLTLLFLELVYLSYKNFSIMTFHKIIKYSGLLFILLLFSYTEFSTVQRQIDKRIFSIAFQETSVIKSAVSNNRDQIYKGITDRLKEGYWLVGLPYQTKIFSLIKSNEELYHASKTDLSFVNILLRFGIIPLIVFIIFLFRLQIIKSVPIIILFIYVLASLNTDSLFNQNSIFFLVLFIIVFMNKKLESFDTESKNLML